MSARASSQAPAVSLAFLFFFSSALPAPARTQPRAPGTAFRAMRRRAETGSHPSIVLQDLPGGIPQLGRVFSFFKSAIAVARPPSSLSGRGKPRAFNSGAALSRRDGPQFEHRESFRLSPTYHLAAVHTEARRPSRQRRSFRASRAVDVEERESRGS